MINKKSVKAVQDAHFSKGFCKPLYDTYCFSQIPDTILSLLTSSKGGLPQDTVGEKSEYDAVVLLFLDAFGWRFFEEYQNRVPFLQKEGIASKITSMFPSTTAAHVTCINTGLTPSQSGIYEWFLYEPLLNDIIAPLPFCFAGERKPGSLLETKLTPEKLYPRETIYQKMQDQGITSYAFQPKDISNTPYSKALLKGANIIGYENPKEAFDGIANVIKPKTYCYFYYGEIDAVGHRKDVTSKEFEKTIVEIFEEIEAFYAKLPPKTAVIITADHGMTSISPKDTYYLNKKVPNISKHLCFGQRNKPLAPAGSCRDLFLHVHEKRLLELKDILSHFLVDRAEVHLTKELIDAKFFGSETPTENFLSRVGNLVVLPYKNEAIWWYEKGRFVQNFYAAHGGLTTDEMETLFLFLSS